MILGIIECFTVLTFFPSVLCIALKKDGASGSFSDDASFLHICYLITSLQTILSIFSVSKLNALFFYYSNIFFLTLSVTILYAKSKMGGASGSFSYSPGFLYEYCFIIPHQTIFSNFLVSEWNAIFIYFYFPNFLVAFNVNTVYVRMKIGRASSSFSYSAGYLYTCCLIIPRQTIPLSFLVSKQIALFVYIHCTNFLYIFARDRETVFILYIGDRP